MRDNQKLPKTMKTAFICVRARNVVTETSEFHDWQVGDEVEYSFEEIKATLEEWATQKKMTYYAIEHADKDNDCDSKHYHIVLDFQGISTASEQVRRKFPFGFIETCRSVKRCVQYLVHLNDMAKEQYKWSSVIHNDERGLERFKVKKSELKFDDLLRKIGNGEIREYEVVNYLDPVTYAKKKKQIDNAVQYYIGKMIQHPERTEENKIRTIVIQGPTRIGKSDIAKALCKAQNKSYCMAGSANDPWEPYKGEDCMILDDLRDHSFPLSTMIKMLDPYNSTLIQRRYHNACFLGDEIIITTNEDIWDFYTGWEIDDESRKAFFSRIELILDFFQSLDGQTVFQLIRFNREKNCFERDSDIYLYKPYYKLSSREKAMLKDVARESQSTEDIIDFYWIERADTEFRYTPFSDPRNIDYMESCKEGYKHRWIDEHGQYNIPRNPKIRIDKVNGISVANIPKQMLEDDFYASKSTADVPKSEETDKEDPNECPGYSERKKKADEIREAEIEREIQEEREARMRAEANFGNIF